MTVSGCGRLSLFACLRRSSTFANGRLKVAEKEERERGKKDWRGGGDIRSVVVAALIELKTIFDDDVSLSQTHFLLVQGRPVQTNFPFLPGTETV